MSPMAFEVMAATALIVLALFAAPRYLKSGITTIPQLLGERYDRPTKLWFSIAYIILYLFVQIPVILYSGSLVFENIFNLSGILGITKFQSIVILCILITIIGSIYAIFGGLKAVAVSDTINGIGLIIGGLMIPFLGFAALSAATGGHGIMDGIKYMVEADPAKMNAINAWNAPEPEVPWPLIITGMFFNNLYWWCTNQSFVQRALAAKSLKEGQKGAIYCGFLKTIGFFYLVLPGVIAYHLPSIQDKLAAAGSSAIDFAYPALIAEIVPKPVMGFFAAVMFGAILSSFNSVLNSSMTLFTLDILPVISKRKRTDAQLITIAKRFGIVLCLASIIIAPFLLYLPAGISTFLNQMWGYYGVPVLAIVVMGILAPRMPSFAPKVAIIVHIVCYGLMMNLLPFHFLYFEVGAFVIDLILMAILTKAAPRKEAYVLPDLEVVDMTPWKYRKPVIAVTFILLAGIYVLFSPLGLGG